MNRYATTLGGINCQIVDALPAGRSPEIVVVLCHGFGAPATDLVPCGPELVHLNPELADRVRFIFPAAPVTLDDQGIPGGRAWWPMDLERLQAAIQRGGLREMRNQHPEQLPAAREKLTALIDEVRGETNLPMSRFVLGGFSQGSMVSTDVALRLDEAPGALVIWSGTLLCEDAWQALTSNVRGLPVLQSHGRQDQILPFENALCLRDLLTAAGADVEFLEFSGGHTIAPRVLDRTAALLGRLLPE